MENENKGVTLTGDLTGDIYVTPPEPIMQFFAYGHLPPDLRETSRLFYELAHEIVRTLPRNAERTVCLRKILEGKDAAVRAKLFR